MRAGEEEDPRKKILETDDAPDEETERGDVKRTEGFGAVVSPLFSSTEIIRRRFCDCAVIVGWSRGRWMKCLLLDERFVLWEM